MRGLLLVMFLLGVGLIVAWSLRQSREHQEAQAVAAASTLPAKAMSAKQPVTLDAGDVAAPETRDLLADIMLSHDDFARDVIFLLASSIRNRCEPQHAHDLTHMVMQARLPVLLGASTVLNSQPELRPKLYELLRHLASMAPCGQLLNISIGKYHMSLDPAGYAAAFPDSYFDPAIDDVPAEFAGRDLHSRSEDPCTQIGYAVLPLGVERAWQCGRLRADARRHLVLDTCAAVLQHSPAPAASALQTTAIQQDMAMAIHTQLERLQELCR
jgi:hypothetical protein